MITSRRSASPPLDGLRRRLRRRDRPARRSQRPPSRAPNRRAGRHSRHCLARPARRRSDRRRHPAVRGRRPDRLQPRDPSWRAGAAVAVALSSGDGVGIPIKHRLDFTANRHINSVLHIASAAKQRTAYQAGAHLARIATEGKTRREARRAHNRQLTNRVIRRMRRDETARNQPLTLAARQGRVRQTQAGCGSSRVSDCEDESAADETNCTADSLRQIICRLHEAGITVVSAAGNQKADAWAFVPAKLSQVISVGAIVDFDGVDGGLGSPTCGPGVDDKIADFSNRGASVDIYAPGVCIRTTKLKTLPDSVAPSGTSLAAAHVAAAAAIYMACHMEATPDEVKDALLDSSAMVSSDGMIVPTIVVISEC